LHQNYDVYVLIIYCIAVLISLDDSSVIYVLYDCTHIWRAVQEINHAFRYRKIGNGFPKVDSNWMHEIPSLPTILSVNRV
jgi:hypothetical protein